MKKKPKVKNGVLLMKLFNVWGIVINSFVLIKLLEARKLIEQINTKYDITVGFFTITLKGEDLLMSLNIEEVVEILKEDFKNLKIDEVLFFFKE